MAVAEDADDTDGGGAWLVLAEASLATFELELELELALELALEPAAIVFVLQSAPRIATTAGWVIQGSCLLRDLVDIADRSGWSKVGGWLGEWSKVVGGW